MVRREVVGNTVRLCAGYPPYFVITGKSKDLLENEVKPLVEQFLKERGLQLSPDKTRITHIEAGFDFLGQNIRKYREGLRTKPSAKNTKTFLTKVRQLIQSNKQTPAGQLIVLLNPIIRGWTQYHRHSASSRTFAKVDHAIFLALWQWAKRRHPKKSRRWVKTKYFKTTERRAWVFHGQHHDKVWELINATDTLYQHHLKIKGKANPFDPQWETYFEQRLDVKMVNNLRGRRQLIHLWKAQNGTCPICQQKITSITGWNNHHILPRTLGGSDTNENRVLLHPDCHQQLHNQRLPVEKPCPVT
ncbi:MAG: group II intron maturase-specific domain-containing protein [Chloroflexota bacterium]